MGFPFPEAQVEPSTDKVGSSARKELSTSSGPPPSSSVTQSPAAMQPSSSLQQVRTTAELCSFLKQFILTHVFCGLCSSPWLQLEEEEGEDIFDVDVAVTNPEKIG